MNTSFYVSPSGLNYEQYNEITAKLLSYGWTLTYRWPREAFCFNNSLKKDALAAAIRALYRTDIYIANLPATGSGHIEIGLAFSLCGEMVLCARDVVHFTQTSHGDAYLALLPSVKTAICNTNQIPILLEKEYHYLIDRRQQIL